MPYTQAEIEQIKNKVRIEDVVTQTTPLEGSGRWLRGSEHSSLVVDRKRQCYHWNRMDEHGDVITWLMHRRHWTFNEAVESLDSTAYLTTNFPTRIGEYSEPETAPERPKLPQGLAALYHAALFSDIDALDWWAQQGIGMDGINRFLLGVCHDHPLYHQLTYTIPVFDDSKLVNIRHRLSEPKKKGDKYRPHMPGLGSYLFNREVLTPELAEIVITAGEKKVVVLSEFGIPAISSTAGCTHWPIEWNSHVRYCRSVYICFDPGEETAAWKVAGLIGPRALVMALPDKPDDYIVCQGKDGFISYMKEAERNAPDYTIWPDRPGCWGRLIR